MMIISPLHLVMEYEMIHPKHLLCLILGVTAATGEVVLCECIFSSEKIGVPVNWSKGIDMTIDPVLDEKRKILISDINLGK